MSNNSAIILFTPEGETRSYIPLAARLPEFLRAYPPEKYSVMTEYEPCPLAGDRPVFVFKASLVDAQGRVVATAHSRRSMDLYKDFESGETAARQRLLASLGFGGEVLDADEHMDFRAQGLTTQGQAPARSRPRMNIAPPPVREEVQQDESPVLATADKPVKEPVKDSLHAVAAFVPDDAGKPGPPPSPSGREEPELANSGVSQLLKRQLEALCASRGIEQPLVGSDGEARKAISAIARSKRGNT